MTRIAVISDIHANLPALETVLTHARKHDVSKIYNLGDFLGYSPFGQECVELIRNQKIVSVVGNYDLKVLDFPHKKKQWKKTKLPEKFFSFQWAYRHITSKTKKYLSSLPAKKIVTVANKKILLTHAGPQAIDEILTPHTSQKRFKQLACGLKVDVVLFGHSHYAFKRKAGNVLFCNPGSVGRQFCGNWHTSYTLLEVSKKTIKFKSFRLPYDVNRVISEMSRLKFPFKILECIKQGKEIEDL